MRIHLIAIGGAVMHNMAIALKKKGYTVTGSDDEVFEPSLSRLKLHGLLPATQGWDPNRITGDLDAVILGMHARANNPELLRAIELGIPFYSFPEYVYLQSDQKTRVAICGSHGKTTITSMVMHVFRQNSLSFDYLVGAQLEGFDTMVQFSDAPLMVIEGDEYFASPLDKQPKFLHYHAQINLISGIAWDHFNVFPTFDNYLDQFRLLIQGLQPDDHLIVNEEDNVLMQLVEAGCAARVIKYRTPAYDISGNKISIKHGNRHYIFEIFGRHNMQNMEGARMICQLAGISDEAFYTAIQNFRGAAKRLEVLKQQADHIVFRDFAHAPSKVKATVDAVKEQYSDKKLIACLELHTYSSLNRSFIPQYANTMKNADVRIVYFNPHTFEIKKLEPVDAAEIKNYFNDTALIVMNRSDELLALLKSLNVVNSNILLMSSGNFDNVDFSILT